ncbi:MAG: hypothetical protein HDT46_08050 [Ruminococcaceae bacterium]|nr:hypothetical protein [Oscillospiraceae bacterium]
MKNAVKKVLSISVALGIILCNNRAYALVEGDRSDSVIFDKDFDTLSLTQEDYESIASNQISAFSINSEANEEKMIQNTCKAYIATSRAYVRRPDRYSGNAFVEEESTSNATIEYRTSEFEYLNKLNEVLDSEIIYDNISFDGFKTDIDGENAEASIVESYSYYRNDGFDIESFRMREYNFKLFKGDNGWEITEVKTNDAWEEEGFNYEPINIDEAINAATESINIDSFYTSAAYIGAESGITPMWSQTLYVWSYNVTNAVNYAEKYFKETHENTVFGINPDDNDCQNFVSQCIWAGLGGSGSNIKTAPAVSTDVTGTENSPYLWCRNTWSNCYNDFRKNWAWDNTVGFTNRITISDAVSPGPYGFMTYGSSSIANASVGQALYFNRNGNATSCEDLNHAMFITNVTGSAGSRTTSNIYIAAHTGYTNSAYDLLSSYAHYSSNQYATATIRAGYYTTPKK